MKPNPINRLGTKNILCPYYRNCLDHAVSRFWQFWDCSECTHKAEQESLGLGRSVHDPNLEYDLSWITLSEI